MSLGCLGCQSHIAERACVDHIHTHIAVLRLCAVLEAVYEQLGIPYFNRADDADRVALGQHCCHCAEHIAALVGSCRVGVDIVQAEGVQGGAPGEGGVGIIRGYLLQRTAVLRAVSDHEIEAFIGVGPDLCGGLFHDESAVCYRNLYVTLCS